MSSCHNGHHSGAGASAVVESSVVQGARLGPGWLWAQSPALPGPGPSHGRHSKQTCLTIPIPVTDLKARAGPVPQRTARCRHRGSTLTLRPRYVWTPRGLAWFRASPGQTGQAWSMGLIARDILLSGFQMPRPETEAAVHAPSCAPQVMSTC